MTMRDKHPGEANHKARACANRGASAPSSGGSDGRAQSGSAYDRAGFFAASAWAGAADE
jgi:hypothetical protein